MKASVQYNDFTGTVAADISDSLGAMAGDDLETIATYFNLDKNRFKIVGISIYGRSEFNVSLICVDKEKSNNNKEHIVNLSCDITEKKEILKVLFKRLHIVLHDKFDTKYVDLDYDEEAHLSDFLVNEA